MPVMPRSITLPDDLGPLLARLDEKTMPIPWSGCWLWMGAILKGNNAGYGIVALGGRKGRKVYVHRLSYVIENGPIPPGLTLDHTCRVRACRNPAHLEPVTNKVNILRGNSAPARNARRTHCIVGHEFTAENTISVQGRRRCRICVNTAKLAAYYNRSAEQIVKDRAAGRINAARWRERQRKNGK